MKCSLCGNAEASVTVLGNHFCDTCNEKIKLLEKNDPKTAAFFRNPSNYPMANEYTVKYINGILSRNKTRVENTESVVFHENVARIDRENRKNNIILSTCPSIDGYVATKQLGLVFGEVYFKSGFFKSLGAAFSNLADGFIPGDRELSGTAGIMSTARQYAIDKMIEEAVQKGANAVIGIDSESSYVDNVTHMTIYGTAVIVEKKPNDR